MKRPTQELADVESSKRELRMDGPRNQQGQTYRAKRPPNSLHSMLARELHGVSFLLVLKQFSLTDSEG